MKRMRAYMVLAVVLSLLVISGWAAEHDIISFLSQKDEDISLILMNTRGEIHQSILTDLERSGSFTWSPDGKKIAAHVKSKCYFFKLC